MGCFCGYVNGLDVLSPDGCPGLGKSRIVVAFSKWEGGFQPPNKSNRRQKPEVELHAYAALLRLYNVL